MHASAVLLHSCPVQQLKAGPRGLHCHSFSELPHLPPTLCTAGAATQRNQVLPDECATAVSALTEAYGDTDRCMEAMAEHSQVGLARLLGTSRWGREQQQEAGAAALPPTISCHDAHSTSLRARLPG